MFYEPQSVMRAARDIAILATTLALGWLGAASARADAIPVCNIEIPARTTPQSLYQVVAYGDGKILRGSPIVAAATLTEAIEKLETLRTIGSCRAAPPEDRRSCTISRRDGLFEVDFDAGRIYRGEDIFQSRDVDQAITVVRQLQAARLCRPAAENTSHARTDRLEDEDLRSAKLDAGSSAPASAAAPSIAAPRSAEPSPARAI